jgi:hypothetical protein
MISSTTSFSIMGQDGSLASLNIFFKAGVSHGLLNLKSNVLITKLKKVLRLAYRIRLVVCLLPLVRWFKNDRISSDVMDFNSLSPNLSRNLVNTKI